MKWLILIAIVAAVIWMARGARRRAVRNAEPPPQPQALMVACSHCGLHLPRDEALPGRGGVFCSEAHRAAFEQAQR